LAETLGSDPSQLLAVIDADEAAIDAVGVNMPSCTAPGDDHGIFEWPRFYEVEVTGVGLVGWVEALITGQHSTMCTAPSAPPGEQRRSGDEAGLVAQQKRDVDTHDDHGSRRRLDGTLYYQGNGNASSRSWSTARCSTAPAA